MTERTPDGSALGFSDVYLDDSGNDPLSDEFVGEPSETAEELIAPEPALEVEEDEEEAPEAPETPEAPEESRLYAGRYADVEQLEKGYTEVQGAWTRDRQQLLQLQQQQQQMEGVLRNLVPILEQQLQQQDPEAAEAYRQQMVMRQQAQQMAEQQVAPLRQQMEIQAQAQRVEALVDDFRQRHPDVPAGSADDQRVASTLQELRLNPINPDSLEVAYEAMRDPYLKQVLVANPVLIDTDEGITYARVQARLLEGLAGGSQPTPSRQPRPKAPPFVETGEGGAPAKAASSGSYDEFDEAFDAWSKERRSPLF